MYRLIWEKETTYFLTATNIVIYIWFTTPRGGGGGKKKWLPFERKVLRKIHGPVRNRRGKYEKRKTAWSRKIIQLVKYLSQAKRLEWVGHVWRANESLIRNFLIKNSTKKATKEKTSPTMGLRRISQISTNG